MAANTRLNRKDINKYKVVFLGDVSVGKTAMILWYVENVYHHSGESTIGSSVYFKRVQCEEREVKLEIWDTAGQERYSSIGPIHCRNAQAVVVCYDVTSEQSFKSVGTWLNHPFIPDSILTVLVGCKADESNRVVTTAMGEAKARSIHPIQLPFFETSAKTHSNVDELFEFIASHLPIVREGEPEEQGIVIDHQNEDSPNSSLCKRC